MALSTKPYKGARDFYPEDKRLQNYMFNKIRRVCESFGYEEYDAPVLEPLELYLAKTSEEIVNEQTYVFEDRGGRQVVIRPEMTPTVSRMVAGKRQELAYPLRWYSIPNLWRYERPQKGRLREHWQLNIDIFGVPGVAAEHEVIMLTDRILRAFGAKPDMYEIKLNSRKFMDYVLGEYLELDEVQRASVARLIDRMKKMDHAEFVAQLDALCSPSQREAGTVDKLLKILAAAHLADLPPELQAHASLQDLNHLAELLADGDVTNAVFDVTLMRGFDYYTDIVFEVFDKHPDNNRSMLGGGRYDGLVGLFGVEPVPTVGFGFGDVTLAEFLKGHGLLPELRPETDLYVTFASDVLEKAQKAVAELRGMGLNVAVDVSGRKLGDQLKAADKKGIVYALIIGENELADGQFTLKNLHTGEEEKHALERIVSIIKDRRHEDEEL